MIVKYSYDQNNEDASLNMIRAHIRSLGYFPTQEVRTAGIVQFTLVKELWI